MILYALIRLQLQVENLRFQTYDGAKNMAGMFHGCQAEIKKHQPLADFKHCGAHISQLVSKAVQKAIVMRDVLKRIYEGKSKSSKTNNINSIFIEVARLFFYIRFT